MSWEHLAARRILLSGEGGGGGGRGGRGSEGHEIHSGRECIMLTHDSTKPSHVLIPKLSRNECHCVDENLIDFGSRQVLGAGTQCKAAKISFVYDTYYYEMRLQDFLCSKISCGYDSDPTQSCQNLTKFSFCKKFYQILPKSPKI